VADGSGQMITFRGHSCPRLGVAGSGLLERLVTPGGLRPKRGGRLPADSTVGCRVTRQRWRHRERTPVSFATSVFRWTRVDSTVEGCGWCRAERNGLWCLGFAPRCRRSRCEEVFIIAERANCGWRHLQRS